MTAFVTGGIRFAGGNVTDHLIENGQVVVLAGRPAGRTGGPGDRRLDLCNSGYELA